MVITIQQIEEAMSSTVPTAFSSALRVFSLPTMKIVRHNNSGLYESSVSSDKVKPRLKDNIKAKNELH